jgi:hypothetical protein
MNAIKASVLFASISLSVLGAFTPFAKPAYADNGSRMQRILAEQGLDPVRRSSPAREILVYDRSDDGWLCARSNEQYPAATSVFDRSTYTVHPIGSPTYPDNSVRPIDPVIMPQPTFPANVNYGIDSLYR